MKETAKIFKNIIHGILYSVFVSPFTAGNIIKNGRGQENPRFDGHISISVLITWIIAIMFVIVIASYFFPYNLTFPLILDIFMFVVEIISPSSVIFLTVFVCYRHHHLLNNRREKEISLTMKTKSLWFFAGGYIFSIINEFVEYSYCLMHGEAVHVLLAHIILRMIGTVFQTGFITYFSKFTFHKCLIMHYCVLIIIFTNFCNWGWITAQEYNEYFLSTSGFENNSKYIPQILENMSCIQNSTFDIFFQSVHPNLFRIMAEYHILSFWLLLTIWKTTSSLERICNENDETNQEYLGICETYHPNHAYDTNDVDDFHANVTQNNAMVINVNFEEPNTESSPLLDDLNGRRRSIVDESKSIQNCRKRVISFYFVILAGMGMYVCMLLGTLVPYFVAVLDEKGWALWNGYQIFITSSRLLLTFAAFCKLEKECIPRSDFTGLNANDYLFLFGAFFNTTSNTLKLIAFTLFTGHSAPNEPIHAVLNLITDFYQTVFIMKANRYKKSTKRDTLWPIENICLFLSIFNFCYWTYFSFMELTRPYVNIVPKAVFSTRSWYVMDFLIVPVTIFYLFHCVLDYFCLYKRLSS